MPLALATNEDVACSLLVLPRQLYPTEHPSALVSASPRRSSSRFPSLSLFAAPDHAAVRASSHPSLRLTLPHACATSACAPLSLPPRIPRWGRCPISLPFLGVHRHAPDAPSQALLLPSFLLLVCDPLSARCATCLFSAFLLTFFLPLMHGRIAFSFTFLYYPHTPLARCAFFVIVPSHSLISRPCRNFFLRSSSRWFSPSVLWLPFQGDAVFSSFSSSIPAHLAPTSAAQSPHPPPPGVRSSSFYKLSSVDPSLLTFVSLPLFCSPSPSPTHGPTSPPTHSSCLPPFLLLPNSTDCPRRMDPKRHFSSVLAQRSCVPAPVPLPPSLAVPTQAHCHIHSDHVTTVASALSPFSFVPPPAMQLLFSQRRVQCSRPAYCSLQSPAFFALLASRECARSRPAVFSCASNRSASPPLRAPYMHFPSVITFAHGVASIFPWQRLGRFCPTPLARSFLLQTHCAVKPAEVRVGAPFPSPASASFLGGLLSP